MSSFLTQHASWEDSSDFRVLDLITRFYPITASFLGFVYPTVDPHAENYMLLCQLLLDCREGFLSVLLVLGIELCCCAFFFRSARNRNPVSWPHQASAPH